MSSFAIDSTSADSLATTLLQDLGRTKGVASVPHCGNGQMARALSQKSGMVVHGFESDPAQLTVAQQLIESLGVLGRTVYIDKGTPLTKMPYADHFLDLLVITDLSSGDLSGVSAAEIERVLSPGGKAWVGRAASEGSLSKSSLQSWITAAGVNLLATEVRTDASGTWAIVTKKNVPGTVEFNHPQGGSDNNQYSNDRVARWPNLPQWKAKPYGSPDSDITNSSQETVMGVAGYRSLFWSVAGGGRLYSGENLTTAPPPYNGITIRARRIYNGQELWVKIDWDARFDGGYSQTPPVAASSDYLCVLRSSGVISVLDGETGNEVKTILIHPTGGISNLKIQVMSLAKNIVYMTGSDGLDNYLAAYDLNTQTLLYCSKTDLTCSRMAVFNGKIYCTSTMDLACYDAALGNLLWFRSKPLGGGKLNTPIASSLGVLVTSGALMKTGDVIHLGADTGRTLWRNSKFVLGMLDTVVHNDRGFVTSGMASINLLTGGAFPSFPLTSGCGLTFTSTLQGLYGQTGFGYSFEDQAIRRARSGLAPYNGYYYRTSCYVRLMPTHGLTIYSQKYCNACDGMIRGVTAEAPMGQINPEQAAVEAERLEPGASYASWSPVVVPAAPDAKGFSRDWHTYRANNQHSGYSPVTVSSTPQLRWRYRNPSPYFAPEVPLQPWMSKPEHVPTPPVVVGGYTFIGGSDGIVKCIDNNTGALAWRYVTGGKIFAAPTLGNGLLYVGSGDGYAYCLEAHTGNLVWRFCAAPLQRLTMRYGHLMNTWPILTGVLLHGGKAFFASGSQDLYGVQVYAVDALTGTMIWQNTGSGVYLDPVLRQGLAVCGYMTVAGDKLWVRSTGLCDAAVFDLATGAIPPLSTGDQDALDASSANAGRFIGVLGNYVLTGGMHYDRENYEYYGTQLLRHPCHWMPVEVTSGLPLYPGIMAKGGAPSVVSPSCNVMMQVWDDQNLYAGGVKYNIADMTGALTNTATAQRAASPGQIAAYDAAIAAEPNASRKTLLINQRGLILMALYKAKVTDVTINIKKTTDTVFKTVQATQTPLSEPNGLTTYLCDATTKNATVDLSVPFPDLDSVPLVGVQTGISIYYTTDGTVPNPPANGTLYSNRFTLPNAPCTLKVLLVLGNDRVQPKTIEGWDVRKAGFLRMSDAVLASNVVVFAGTAESGDPSAVYTSGQWYMATCSKTGAGDLIWRKSPPLPTPPIRDGMALDRHGNIIVALCSGDVMCFGGSTTAVALPMILPDGGDFANTVTLEASSFSGGTISYTLDGSDPMASATKKIYNGFFTLNSSCTIAVKAVDGNNMAQNVSILINGQAVAAAQKAPTYAYNPMVLITDETPGATIQYTMDGTDPSPTTGLTYSISAPPLLTKPCTFKAMAYKAGLSNSPVVSANFNTHSTLLVSAPSISAVGNVLTLSCATTNANIYYRIDNREVSPTQGTLYTGPFTLSRDATLAIMAHKDGWENSSVITAHINAQVSNPVITPASGTYVGSKSVRITAYNDDNIRYTTDGSDPQLSPTSIYIPAKIFFPTSVSFTITNSTTVKAVAVRNGYADSDVTTVTCVILQNTVQTPLITWSQSSPVVSLSCATTDSSIYYTTDGTSPVPNQNGTILYPGSAFTLSSTATVKAIACKTGMTNSPLASADVFNIAPPSISPDGGAFSTETDPILITCTTPGVTIRCTVDGNTPTATSNAAGGGFVMRKSCVVKAIAFKAGLANSAMTTSNAFTVLKTQAVPPVIAPAGGIFIDSIDVRAFSNVANVGIHYTTDGSTPTSSSPLYTGSFALNKNTTVKVIAIASGLTDSDVATAVFNMTVSTPVITPHGGNFMSLATFTLKGPEDAQLYYTTDGNTPTSASIPYTGPVPLNQRSMVKAVACKAGNADSSVTSAVFTVGIEKPVMNPGGGTFTGSTNVILNTPTIGAEIYYTTNGDTPTAVTGTRYTGAVSLNASEPFVGASTLKAVAFKSGCEDSAVSSGIYTVYTPKQAWRAQNGLPVDGTGNGADNASPAGDGVSNLMKYALGLNPLVPSTAAELPQVSVENGHLKISFTRNANATDITYEIQASNDLQIWNALATYAAGATAWVENGATVSENVGGAIKVTGTDQTFIADQLRRFLRLKISE